MEFQVNEAVELIKVLADTENLTLQEAFKVFIAESGLDVEYAAELKGALYETYTLKEMASDSLTNALMRVFVNGESVEDIQEVSTKETAEGTKYQIRVKDAKSGSSYTRYATREKIAELRANPNISSVELTDYGDNEDRDGQKTAAAKGGGDRARRDYDGDGKVESGSKEHAGAVHNAIQRAKGGKPDGRDTRREEYELEEGKKEADLDKMQRQERKHIKKSTSQRGGGRGDSKNRAMKMNSIRSAIERGEDPRRDTYGGKRTRPEDHRKAFTRTPLTDRPAKEPGVKKESNWEAYLELREARAKTKEEARKKIEAHRAAMKDGGDSPYFGKIKDGKMVKQSDPWSTHASDAKAHKKEDMGEGYKGKHGQSDSEYADSRSQGGKMVSGDSKMSGAEYTHGRRVKAENPGMQPDVGGKTKPKSQGKMDKGTRADLEYRKAKLKKEEYFLEADLVDAGRENEGQRKKKKLTGEGVDNSTNVKLMPVVGESVITSKKSKAFEKLKSVGESKVRDMIPDLTEKCCDKCGTPECTCENKKEEPKKKKETKLDEAGMPILEYSRNNAEGPGPEMINPPKDEDGEVGTMNPKGKPKRQKKAGETSGDRRPNNGGPDLPAEDGTVPSGCGC